MKSILLTSTALVAFAGVAAAQETTGLTFGLDGTIGYTDNENTGRIDGDFGEDGFFWEGNLTAEATTALDNGLSAGVFFEVTINEDDGEANNDFGQDLVSSDFVLSLVSDTASLFFGDTGTAADQHWVSAGDMEADGFTSGNDSAALRGDVSFGGVDASISYLVDDENDEVEQLSFGAAATFGIATFTAAYQEDTDFADGSGDFNGSEVYGVSVAATVASATITLAYAEETERFDENGALPDRDSVGIEVSVPFGPVVGTAYYVEESGDTGVNDDPNFGVNIAYSEGPLAASIDYQDDQTLEKIVIEGSYELGNGLTIFAGALNENEEDYDYYAAAEYDLGGGATAIFAFAEDDDGDQADEIGSEEYDPGFTIQLDFEF